MREVSRAVSSSAVSHQTCLKLFVSPVVEFCGTRMCSISRDMKGAMVSWRISGRLDLHGSIRRSWEENTGRDTFSVCHTLRHVSTPI